MNNNDGEIPEGKNYSRSLDQMTGDDPNDLIGLVAYARYKQMIQDHVKQGLMQSGAPKNPSDKTVEFFRSAARSQLQDFAAAAIDEARDEIQQSAILSEIENLGTDLKAHVSSSTGAGRAIWTNVVGWIVTLFITALILITHAYFDFGELLARLKWW